MSHVTVPPIPTNISPDIPASAIAASDATFAQFLETIMTKQRGHRQADTADVSLAKLQSWTRELFQLQANKKPSSDQKKRVHAIRQNISRTQKKHPWLLKALAQQAVTL
jgi:hypothetical protein